MNVKRFKSRKVKKKKSKFKVILFTFFFFFSYVFIIRYLINNRLDKNILTKDVSYINFDVLKFINNKIDEKINRPVNLLNENVKGANSSSKVKTTSKSIIIPVSKTEIKNEYKPEIYIYNTHQGEKYTDFSVYDAARHLSSKLQDKGHNTYFEENSVPVFLQENSLKYYKSYTASKKFLIDAKEKYQSLNYFFDIHRDALSKEKSTFIKDGISYAKIMFVVGLDNKNYEKNLENAERLNKIVEKNMPGISRGILKKQGKGVDGVYNQDVSENVFLIEVGGNYNTKDEVIRTIDILTSAIIEYIGSSVWLLIEKYFIYLYGFYFWVS